MDTNTQPEKEMTEEEFKIVEAMARYGGSFVSSLAQCFHHADPINFIRLKEAFMDYWLEYKDMATREKTK